MADFLETWNEHIPTGDTDVDKIDDEIRSCREAIKERLQPNIFFDENITKDQHNSDGNFRKFIFSNSESVSSGLSNAVILHAKDVDSKARLHITDEDGNAIELTKIYPYHAEEETERTRTYTSFGAASYETVSFNSISGALYEILVLMEIKRNVQHAAYTVEVSPTPYEAPAVTTKAGKSSLMAAYYQVGATDFQVEYRTSGLPADEYIKVSFEVFVVGDGRPYEVELNFRTLDSGGTAYCKNKHILVRRIL